jgi:hypothetical protein
MIAQRSLLGHIGFEIGYLISVGPEGGWRKGRPTGILERAWRKVVSIGKDVLRFGVEIVAAGAFRRTQIDPFDVVAVT